MRDLVHNHDGASAAEFALVLPLLILLLFGIIDGGRFLWEVNKAEKATQVGARVAVVTNALPQGLVDASYLDTTTPSQSVALTQGDLIPRDALGVIRCASTGCTCATGPCPALGTFNTAAFTRVADRMRLMKPDITNENIRIEYRGSGLGYAGDPNGMEVVPLVTVELRDQSFNPLILFSLASVSLPSFRTTLTGEDSVGTQSN